MPKTITCTPYEGTLTEKQQSQILDLLWDYLKPVKGKDQVQTGWGTKTQTGLLAALEGIVRPESPSKPSKAPTRPDL